jgi:hypothetical protein
LTARWAILPTIVLTKYILAVLAAVFLFSAAWRATSGRGWRHPQVRSWLLVAAIFSGVSAWLFYNR